MFCTRRDGVSDGQFLHVLLYEMDAIKKVMIFDYVRNYTFIMWLLHDIFIYFFVQRLLHLWTQHTGPW